MAWRMREGGVGKGNGLGCDVILDWRHNTSQQWACVTWTSGLCVDCEMRFHIITQRLLVLSAKSLLLTTGHVTAVFHWELV